MALDTLVLGGMVFTDFAVPEHMPFGGEQAMVVHKLPGGQRVIDTLGPDDMNITWNGRFWGNGALGQAMALDAMRRAGTPLPLVYAGHAYIVVIDSFSAEIERVPMNVLYHISCTVATNSMGGGAGGGGFGGGGWSSLASLDLAAAGAL